MYANLMHQRNHDNGKKTMRVLKPHYPGCYNKWVLSYHSAEALHRRYSNPMVSRWNPHYNQQPYNNRNDILPRAIRRVNFESSLFPHGDPMPEDYIDSWDERPECPRLKWIYQENPSWQPPIDNRHGEYSGTELIRAAGDDVLKTSFNHLNDLSANVRLQTWQVASTKDIKDTPIATNVTSDYETGDSNSDSSSVKSGSSADWCPRKFLAALW